MITPSIITATSKFSGFKNDQAATFSASISGQTLSAGDFTTATATATLDNSNSVSQVLVQWSGAQDYYNVINGVAFQQFDTNQYQVGSMYYFSGTTLSVYTYVANMTGGNYDIPNLTINCRAFVFDVPF